MIDTTITTQDEIERLSREICKRPQEVIDFVNFIKEKTKQEILELPEKILQENWCNKCWVKKTKSDVEEFCNEKKCAEMRFCELLKQKIKETK